MRRLHARLRQEDTWTIVSTCLSARPVTFGSTQLAEFPRESPHCQCLRHVYALFLADIVIYKHTVGMCISRDVMWENTRHHDDNLMGDTKLRIVTAPDNSRLMSSYLQLDMIVLL